MPRKKSLVKQHGLSSPDLAARTASLMLDKHARDVTIMDLRGITSVTDFFVIGTGESDVQVRAIVNHMDDVLRQEGEAPHSIEGADTCNWVIVDCINVVAHIFSPSSRDYYGLERLWADAQVTDVTDPAS